MAEGTKVVMFVERCQKIFMAAVRILDPAKP